ncbi:hypothetical protein [Rhizobium tubonense]|uniref:Uncharacterized protein n=1 Tax=Rhizobium tubonense TaxID=484088 RepID=A0A2W4CIC6_9HYPH|nr:hypothetical protein [Rhizobium tubonense]PZM12827.1 hypothetical protein CPY51_14815 [Rhizobium tubonense]
MKFKGRAEFLTLEEFSQRFIERMVRHPDAVYLRDGLPVRRYAENVAHAYWIEALKQSVSPEDCADTDMSGWVK